MGKGTGGSGGEAAGGGAGTRLQRAALARGHLSRAQAPGTHGAEGSGTFREGVGVILARRGSLACGEREGGYSL